MLTDGRKPGLDVLSFPAVNRGVINHLDVSFGGRNEELHSGARTLSVNNLDLHLTVGVCDDLNRLVVVRINVLITGEDKRSPLHGLEELALRVASVLGSLDELGLHIEDDIDAVTSLPLALQIEILSGLHLADILAVDSNVSLLAPGRNMQFHSEFFLRGRVNGDTHLIRARIFSDDSKLDLIAFRCLGGHGSGVVEVDDRTFL